MSDFTATIGLEVHVELATKSKMFCGCTNSPHDSEPNANVCPVCMAHPGTLPVPNEEAVALVLAFGKAVKATQATYSEFDRKNYFYPDIPKAYQISQYAFPLLTGGSLCGVELTRVHLEEDTARSQHDKSNISLVDYNRAGVPLMELVTEPVLHDAVTAAAFARELQLVLQTLNISSAQMDRGEMRVEANISVSRDPNVLGVKVEVKNLNSFKSVEGAIVYEINRQTSELKNGRTITQETRGWDEAKLKTFTQRTKETAKDYRYFPDPDIPSLSIGEYPRFSAVRLAENMPYLPEEKRLKYKDIGLTRSQIEQIISDKYLDETFAQLFATFTPTPQANESLKLAANYLTSDVSFLRKSGITVLWSTESIAELITMILAKEITSRVAKDILPALVCSTTSPRALVTEKGLLANANQADLVQIIDRLLADNEAIVEEYKAGKVSSLQYLIGQGMKLTRGSADPVVLSQMIVDKLS